MSLDRPSSRWEPADVHHDPSTLAASLALTAARSHWSPGPELAEPGSAGARPDAWCAADSRRIPRSRGRSTGVAATGSARQPERRQQAAADGRWVDVISFHRRRHLLSRCDCVHADVVFAVVTSVNILPSRLGVLMRLCLGPHDEGKRIIRDSSQAFSGARSSRLAPPTRASTASPYRPSLRGPIPAIAGQLARAGRPALGQRGQGGVGEHHVRRDFLLRRDRAPPRRAAARAAPRRGRTDRSAQRPSLRSAPPAGWRRRPGRTRRPGAACRRVSDSRVLPARAGAATRIRSSCRQEPARPPLAGHPASASPP